MNGLHRSLAILLLEMPQLGIGSEIRIWHAHRMGFGSPLQGDVDSHVMGQ